MRKPLLENTAIYFFANILNASIPFLLLPVLTRVLTPNDFGVITMFSLFVSITNAFTGLSLHGAISVRYFQYDAERLAGYVGSCIGILFIATAVTMIFVGFAKEWLEELTKVPSDWLLAGVVLSGTQFIIEIRLALWRAQQKAKQYGFIQVAQGVVNAGLSLYLIFIIGLAWEGRLLGQIIAAICFMLLSIFWLLDKNEVKLPNVLRDDVIDALRFGIPLIPHVVGGVLIVGTSRYVITDLLDLSVAGIYMVAMQISQGFTLITGAFNKAYAPWLMGKLGIDDLHRDRKIVRATYLYFIIVILMALTIGLMAPAIFLLVGNEFRSGSSILIYLLIGQAFGGMYLMVTNYIFFASKTPYLAWITFFSGILNFAITYLLVKYNGIQGAAQAFLISKAIMFLGTWILSHKARPMPWLAAICRPGSK